MINLWQTKNRWRKKVFRQYGCCCFNRVKMCLSLQKNSFVFPLDLSLSHAHLFSFSSPLVLEKGVHDIENDHLNNFIRFFAFRVMAIFCHLFSLTKAADSDDFSSSLNDDGNRFYPIFACVCAYLCWTSKKSKLSNNINIIKKYWINLCEWTFVSSFPFSA